MTKKDDDPRHAGEELEAALSGEKPDAVTEPTLADDAPKADATPEAVVPAETDAAPEAAASDTADVLTAATAYSPAEADVASEPAVLIEADAPSKTNVPEGEGVPPASGGQTRDADALWASLSSDASPGTPSDASHADALGSAEEDAPEYAFAAFGEEGATLEEGAAADADKKPRKKQRRERAPASGPFGGKTLGPVVPARAFMMDEDGVLVPTPHTITSRLFAGLALIPLVLPLLLLAVQVAFTLDTRALWYSDEVRYADAYQNIVNTGNWLVLQMNGAIYPDKPPMFFWFLRGLDNLAAMFAHLLPFAVTQAMVFYAGVAVSGLLCLLGVHAMASLVARGDRRTVLAADLVLLGGFFFAGLLHYLRMDLLFTACITFSHVFLFHALVREKAPLLMLLGFLAAGAAVLVKGPLGFALPLLAALCFLAWQGRLLRLFRLDFIFGLIFGLALPAAWLTLAWMNAGDAFLDNILHKQILARALNTWHHAEPWYHYLMTFPLIWLPWTLLFLFLPWGRFMSPGMRQGIAASRTKDGAGTAYLWCAVLPGFVLLSAVSIKIPIYCLPLFPPLAILCAGAILRMRPLAAACLQYSLALCLAVLGLSLLLLPMVPAAMLPIPLVPRGVMLLGGICLVFACILAFLVKTRRGEGMVLVMALFTTALAYPLWSVTAPSLDVFLSPKAQADVLREYRDAGYTAVSYKVYPGTYSYYAGAVRDVGSWEEALAEAGKNPKALMALRAAHWDKLEHKPEGFVEVNRQTIAERAYVLVARPPQGGAPEKAPAEPVAKPVKEAPAVAVEAQPEAPEAPAEAAEKPVAQPEPPAAAPEVPAASADAAAEKSGAEPEQAAMPTTAPADAVENSEAQPAAPADAAPAAKE